MTLANKHRFVAPLLFSTILSILSATGSGPYIVRQKKWLEATEQRVGLTASIISSMKGVKILGIVDAMRTKIRMLRNEEVQHAKSVRIFYAIFTVLQTLSLSGTRWITYTVYGIVVLVSSSEAGLNVNRLFTSLAILNIFMERLEIFLRQMPRIASAFGCLHRIEVFLLSETKRDSRLVNNTVISEVADSYELQLVPRYDSVITIKDLSIGWTKEHAIVQGITIDITQGSFTMVIGP